MFRNYQSHIMDIDYISAIIGREFPIYRTEIRGDRAAFFINPSYNLETLEKGFDRIRLELVPKGYIPFLTREHGEFLILVGTKPKTHPMGIWANIIMFILTVISTIAAGAVMWAEFISPEKFTSTSGPDPIFIAWSSPANWFNGALFFALPLMLILGIHETGHYLMAKKHKVSSSLPFFIPAPPPIFMLGTFGAFISMRDPIPNRKALVEIGAAGPIAGFIVALPVTLVGLHLTNIYDITVVQRTGEVIYLGVPPIFAVLETILPVSEDAALHPTAFAGWVGLFVTFLNLLPAGQLDGGHIARAILGEKSKFLSFMVVAFLFTMGIFFFTGTWLLFALLVLFLGLRHPPSLNEFSLLGTKQKLIAAFAGLMFVLCFTPQPFVLKTITPEIYDIYSYVVPDNSVRPVLNGTEASINIYIENRGNIATDMNIAVEYIEIGRETMANRTPLMNATAVGIDSRAPHLNPEVLWSTARAMNLTVTQSPKLFSVNVSGIGQVILDNGKSKILTLESKIQNESSSIGDMLLVNITIEYKDYTRNHYVMFYHAPLVVDYENHVKIYRKNMARLSVDITWNPKSEAFNVGAELSIAEASNSTVVRYNTTTIDEIFVGNDTKWSLYLASRFITHNQTTINLYLTPPRDGNENVDIFIYIRSVQHPLKLKGNITFGDIYMWLESNVYFVIHCEVLEV